MVHLNGHLICVGFPPTRLGPFSSPTIDLPIRWSWNQEQASQQLPYKETLPFCGRSVSILNFLNIALMSQKNEHINEMHNKTYKRPLGFLYAPDRQR